MATRYPMRVIPYDSLTRVLVTSQRDPNERYLVDLSEFNGNGRCSCMGFSVEFLKGLQALPESWSDWEGDLFRCKHIKLARVALGLQLLDTLLRNEKTKEEKSHLDQGVSETGEVKKEGYALLGIDKAEPEACKTAVQVHDEEDGALPKAQGILLKGVFDL